MLFLILSSKSFELNILLLSISIKCPTGENYGRNLRLSSGFLSFFFFCFCWVFFSTSRIMSWITDPVKGKTSHKSFFTMEAYQKKKKNPRTSFLWPRLRGYSQGDFRHRISYTPLTVRSRRSFSWYWVR